MKSSTTHKTESWAFHEPETTSLGQTAASIAAEHDGESGFLLLDRGRDALSWRLILADAAEKSIDVMYFLWKNDEAGKGPHAAAAGGRPAGCSGTCLHL
jgi:putative cardiolipin synthase